MGIFFAVSSESKTIFWPVYAGIWGYLQSGEERSEGAILLAPFSRSGAKEQERIILY